MTPTTQTTISLDALNKTIAEQKGVDATNLSRTHGFPLQIKVEKQ